MNRGVRTLLVLVVAAVAAAGVASFAAYRAIRTRPVQRVEMATQAVVVAARSLPVGAMLGENDVRVLEWPAKNPVPAAIARPEAVVGRGVR